MITVRQQQRTAFAGTLRRGYAGKRGVTGTSTWRALPDLDSRFNNTPSAPSTSPRSSLSAPTTGDQHQYRRVADTAGANQIAPCERSNWSATSPVSYRLPTGGTVVANAIVATSESGSPKGTDHCVERVGLKASIALATSRAGRYGRRSVPQSRTLLGRSGPSIHNDDLLTSFCRRHGIPRFATWLDPRGLPHD